MRQQRRRSDTTTAHPNEDGDCDQIVASDAGGADRRLEDDKEVLDAVKGVKERRQRDRPLGEEVGGELFEAGDDDGWNQVVDELDALAQNDDVEDHRDQRDDRHQRRGNRGDEKRQAKRAVDGAKATLGARSFAPLCAIGFGV